MKKQPYEPPKLEQFQFGQIMAGFSFPVGTDSLEPVKDLLKPGKKK
jgi:hypothetical protein